MQGKRVPAATASAASVRSIAYPWSRSGLRPDCLLEGSRSAQPGGGSRQQTRAVSSRDFGPPCSADASVHRGGRVSGPASPVGGRNPRRSAPRQPSKARASSENAVTPTRFSTATAGRARTDGARMIASLTDWATPFVRRDWPHRFCLLTVIAQPIRGSSERRENHVGAGGNPGRLARALGERRPVPLLLRQPRHPAARHQRDDDRDDHAGDGRRSLRRRAGRLVARRLRARRDLGRRRSRAAGQLRAAQDQHGGRRAALRGRRTDLRGGTVDADIPARPPDRRAGRRCAGLARLHLGRAAVPARHLAAIVRRHVGDLGRGSLCRPAVRRADCRSPCRGAGRSGCSRSPASPWQRRASWC